MEYLRLPTLKMSLENYNYTFKQKINSPRSVLAIYRLGYSTVDFLLESKSQYVERYKDQQKGNFQYDQKVQLLTEKIQNAQQELQNINNSGITEAEFCFLGQPQHLQHLITTSLSKTSAVQMFGQRNSELAQKNIASLANRQKRQKEVEQFQQMQEQRRMEYQAHLNKRRGAARKQFLEEKEVKKLELQKKVETIQSQIVQKQEYMFQQQEVVRQRDAEKNQKIEAAHQLKLQQQKQLAEEKNLIRSQKLENMQSQRENYQVAKEQRQQQLIEELEYHKQKADLIKYKRKQHLSESMHEREQVIDVQVLKAQIAKEQTIAQKQFELEQKEKRVAPLLQSYQNEVQLSRQEKQQLYLQRSQSVIQKRKEYDENLYLSQQHYHEETSQKQMMHTTNKYSILEQSHLQASEREAEHERKKQQGIDAKRQREFQLLLQKTDIEQKQNKMSSMLEQRQKLAQQNVQNSVRYSALRDVDESERQKLQSIFMPHLSQSTGSHQQKQIKSRPFSAIKDQTRYFEDKVKINYCKRVGTDQERVYERKRLDEMIELHKSNMLRLVLEQQLKEKKRTDFFNQQKGGAALLAVQNEERAADKRQLEQLEIKQVQELKQTMFFFKKRFEGQ